MGNYTSERKSAPAKSKTKTKGKRSITPGALQLIVKIAGKPTEQVPLAKLNTEKLAQLEQHWRQSKGKVTIDFCTMSRWPSDVRWPLLSALQRLGNRLTAVAGTERYPDAFRAALAAMPGTEDLRLHLESIRGVTEAAALFCPQVSATAAGMIAKRIKELGAQPDRAHKIAKEIQLLAGGGGKQGSQPDASDPHALAEKFVQTQRQISEVTDEDQPVLLYFRSEFYRWISKIWQPVEDDLFRADVTKFLQQSAVPKVTSGLVENVITNLRGLCMFGDWSVDMPFRIESMNPPRANKETFLVCENGIVHLDTIIESPGTTPEPHDSRYVTTFALPCEYAPLAECRRWHRFLNQVLPKANQQDRRQESLQEFFGYSLLGDCRFEKALLLFGSGSNGKSTIMRIWELLLGARNVSHIALDQLSEEFRLVDLRGKAANFSTESDHMGRAKENLLKQIISGEPITVNRKYKSTIELRPFAKLVVACNELPTFSDPTDGMWRRLIVMPFDFVVREDQADKQLAKKLAKELPGILNWAIAGLKRLLEQQQFTHCSRCEEVLSEHRTASDTVAEFFDECVIADSKFDVNGQRLYEVYRFYCKERGRQGVAATRFGARIKRMRKFEKRRATPTEDPTRPYLFTGMCLTPTGSEWMRRYATDAKPGWKTITIKKDETKTAKPSMRSKSGPRKHKS